MRIAIINYSSRRIGGTEDYLSQVLPDLAGLDNEICFASQIDSPKERQFIELPAATPRWCVETMGVASTLEAIRDWGPDLIYSHGELQRRFEEPLLDIAPTVYFAHNYYGTCIGGHKAFQFPAIQPCTRKFGSACLLHYFPRRCGGLSPLTMLRLYVRESRRQELLYRYNAIVTHSSHMRDEYLRHGFPADRVYNFNYQVNGSTNGSLEPVDLASRGRTDSRLVKLLFVGRMERLKGGQVLLKALPHVAESLRCRVSATFLGDGRQRKSWEALARFLEAGNNQISVSFIGWVDKESLSRFYDDSDLLVVPSLWPEPFGRIGPEAGSYGLPVAAFAVGGITDWLKDDVNGYLAPADPPTPSGLVDAITKCLRDSATHKRLRKGAVQLAARYNMQNHTRSLLAVFNNVLERQAESRLMNSAV